MNQFCQCFMQQSIEEPCISMFCFRTVMPLNFTSVSLGRHEGDSFDINILQGLIVGGKLLNIFLELICNLVSRQTSEKIKVDTIFQEWTAVLHWTTSVSLMPKSMAWPLGARAAD